MNILILFGGVSEEHDVSIKSAKSIINNLDKSKYNLFIVYITKNGEWLYIKNHNNLDDISNIKAILSPVKNDGLIIFENPILTQKIDVIFPVLHGKNGEDGTIQGLFELSNIPYVGCGVSASCNSMDKSNTKIIVDTINVPQSPFVLVRKHNDFTIPTDFAFPLFVKPCSSGSSVGVFKVNSKDELEKAVKNAFLYDDKVLIEKNIVGKEVEVAILGNSKPLASVVGEIDLTQEFYSYDAKYEDTSSKTHIPANIDEQYSTKIKEYALMIYKALDCKGLSRVDFFLTENGEIIFNEINTLPGFTNISMYPKLFEKTGISYSDLLDKLIEYAGEQNG